MKTTPYLAENPYKTIVTIPFVGLLLLASMHDAMADIKADADSILNWGESVLPALMSFPQPTQQFDKYWYRAYAATDFYAAINAEDNRVYYGSIAAFLKGVQPTFYKSVADTLKDVAASKSAGLARLLGRWEVIEAKTTVYEGNATEGRVLGKFGEGLAYIFHENGTHDGCILSGSDWDKAGQSGALGTWLCSATQGGNWQVNAKGTANGFLKAGSEIVLHVGNLTTAYTIKSHSSTHINWFKKDVSAKRSSVFDVTLIKK